MQTSSSTATWRQTNIGSVCRLINGRAYKKSELLDAGKYRVLRVGNFFTSDHWYFSNLELEPDKYCSSGDLLYAWSASFGPRFWAGEKSIFHYHIWKVDPDPAKVTKEFLFYFFEWDKDKIRDEQGAGATMVHVSKTSMEARRISLPSLSEQKRIVAILDQAFAALDRARAHTEANLADADSLYASALDEMIRQSRSSWDTGTVSSLVGEVSTGPFGSLLHKRDYIDGGVPIINPSNIVEGAIEPDWTKTVSAETAERLGSYRLCADDLVIGRRGEMGRCAPVLPEMDGWLCGTGSFIVRPKPEVSPEFVSYLMRSRMIVDRLSAIATGATMPNLSNRALAQMPFELPAYDVQIAMLAEMKALEAKTADLRAAFAAKLTDITALRQSLLQQAFSGQLT